MFYCIVPFSRTNYSSNVYNNFLRQNTQEKQLIIVQNGAGKWERIGSEIILESDQGMSEPMNVGLEWMRNHAKPDDWFCKFDDDDLYYENYLSSINQEASACGRNSCYMKNTQGEILFIEGKQEAWCDKEYVFGPTICGKLRDSVDFRHVDQYGEDQIWWEEMSNKPRYLGPTHSFIYCRHPNHNHAFPFSDESFKNLYTGRLYKCLEWSIKENRPKKMELIKKELESGDFDRMIAEMALK